MPDNGEIGDRDKVLSDCYGAVQVEYNMPPAAWDKHRLTRSLKNLKLWREKSEPIISSLTRKFFFSS